VCVLHEILLCLLKAPLHRFDWILGKLWISYYHLVELISQKVSALCSTMTIVNGKERASWPEVDLLEFGLDDI